MTWRKLHGQALDAVFKALTAQDIPWLVLRNHQGLPWSNTSKDIDIGIEQRRLREAEVVVEGVMKVHGFDRKETSVFQWGRCTSYFGVVDGAAVSIKIDLMDGFSWRTAGLFDSARLMERARVYEGFQIPDPIDDATIMWLKPLMTGAWVKPAYVPGITAGVKADPGRFRANLDRLFRKDLAELAWQHLERGDYEALTKHAKQLSWDAWAREVASRPVQSAKNVFSYIVLELIRRARRPRATFLAVLGADGVDKSNFIAALREELARLQAKEPDVVEAQHFPPCDIPGTDTSDPELLASPDGTPVGRTLPPAPGIAQSLARIGICWLNTVWGYWTRTRRRCIRGRTVVVDGYFHDVMGDPERSRPGLSLAVEKTLMALTPKPDLIFLLNTDPEAVTERREPHDTGGIVGQSVSDGTLQQARSDRILCVDAHLGPHENARKAATEIVERLYRQI